MFTDRLPAKFKDRGPRVIETPNTKGHAWIMEGQSRPSVMGFSSMYFRSSKRYDRASLVEGFKQIKDRGVRYEDVFPGSYDPAARVKEILEDQIDAEVIFNGVGTVWNGHQALSRQGAEPRVLPRLQRLDRRVPGATRPSGSSAMARCRPPASTTRWRSCSGASTWACARSSSSPTRAARSPSPRPDDDRFWAAAVELDMPINVHTQFFFPYGDLGSKITADGVPESRARAKKLGVDVEAGSFPAILYNMISSGVFERFPDLKFVGTEVHTGWIPYYLERFDESVLRNRHDWELPLLPSEYFRRNVKVAYVVDEAGAAIRYDIGVANILWGPDFPHSSSSWPVDYELGREILERAGATPSEVERIMWRNAADLYKVPYDEPATVKSAA